MKALKYLSPSAISLYVEDKVKYYMNYLADCRPEREPQTDPMAIGSAFDAFVKSYLYEAIFGKRDPRFERMAIFEAQVEPQNRDKAYPAGEYCFEQYKKSGCLADLMLELRGAATEPRFEFDIMGQVDGYREGVTLNIGPIPLLGKPDVYFTNTHGARVVYDWKVNGFYSKYNISPVKGYVRMRDAFQNYGAHKECHPHLWNGVKVNIGCYLETLKPDWARQLAIYSWLCGEEVGTEQCIAGIDQLVCNPDSIRPYPKIRIAEHRMRIGKEFQFKTLALAQEIWRNATSGWFFRDMTEEASKERQALLDTMVDQLKTPVGDNDDWFKRATMR
jgi:hypothetical protein